MKALSYKELPEDFFEMVPQAAVRATTFPKSVPQNAIWDFIRTPGGRFFFSLCAEGSVSASGKLYEYFPDNGRCRLCFDLEKVCLVGPRAIPPSKIHTSMDNMPDGRLIMVTHSTAPAPKHPYWLFDAYYSHLWEGFAGSHLLIYDPVRDSVQNLGIPVPHESIYGGLYDSAHHAYYAIGYVRGHLYRHDLKSSTTRDLGQVSEFGSYRLTRGPDGNLYGNTRTGWIYRIDVDKQKVVDLRVRLPIGPNATARTQYVAGAIGPDGRLYMANHVSDSLAALDVKTGRLEVLGSCDPGPIVQKIHPRCPVGLVFDDSGVLWYAFQGWSHLVRWDVTRGGKPEGMGLLGTLRRSSSFCSEIIFDRNALYITDTCHAEDPPMVLRVDLKVLQQCAGKARRKTLDPYAYALLGDGRAAYPGDPKAMARYHKLIKLGKVAQDFYAGNTYTIQAEEAHAVRLWHSVPVEESSVRKVRWLDNHTLQGICGATRRRAFTWSLGNGLTVLKASAVKTVDAKIPEPAGLTRMPKAVRGLSLPHRQGRQYLAVASCWVPWHDGQALVGTQDGMLARIDLRRKTVFALGAAAVHGPVHQIVTNKAGTVAYGVAGDEWDLGSCFRYDDATGIWELGRTFTFECTKPGLACSCQPCCLALSPDETCLAIGAADRLGTVYIYRRPKSRRMG